MQPVSRQTKGTGNPGDDRDAIMDSDLHFGHGPALCRVCKKPGKPWEHGGNCEEKDQVLRDFEEERA